MNMILWLAPYCSNLSDFNESDWMSQSRSKKQQSVHEQQSTMTCKDGTFEGLMEKIMILIFSRLFAPSP